jgi:serine/threonine protein kinase
MSDETKVSYGYDPLAKSGSDRWGHKGGEKHKPPEIPGYEFLDVLGAGAMGVVWSAKYKPLNQPRAVKVMSRAMALDSRFLARFGEEAKMLARLEHPNIVKVYDASAEMECPYIAMDFVAGKTFNDVIRERFPLPNEEALKYLDQTAKALDYAHSMGFIHRDIKPTNIMITNTGNAMLIDFGVARWVGEQNSKNAVIGTTRYMSPEACRGERLTKSSDLWAFAVLMWRVMTGGMPFDGKTEQAVTQAILNSPPNQPKNVKGRVRSYLKEILAKDPLQRPQSAQQMVDGLRMAIWPLGVRPDRERLTLASSFGVFGAVVALFVGATIWYASTHQKPKEKLVVKYMPSKSSSAEPAISKTAPAAKTGDEAAPAPSELGYMKGVWYATFGDQYAEIHVSPTSGRKFHAILAERDQTGTATGEADGEITADSQVKYTETKIDEVANGKTPTLGTFEGQISEDHARISGERSETGGQATDGQWVRVDDIATTPYESAQGQFSLAVPAGWQTTNGDSTSFSPIGRPDVVFAVTIAPIGNTQTVQELFANREQTFTAAGSYQNLGVNPSAPLGGRQAVSWELTAQGRHGLILGILRADTSVTVESWWPPNEEDTWSPVLESMRKHFAFTD